jgi:AcrR family transcriptional regulator
MDRRLSRNEQRKRNRSLVLRSARRVFLARGYHGATLERIAEEAGFSKGVMYSQFASKADLFLALLDARIKARAAENVKLVAGAVGDLGMAAFLEGGARVAREEPEWALLVIEFRVHAARDPELNERYAALHARTVDGIARLFTEVYEGAADEPPLPPRELAEALLAIDTGVALEQAANPSALKGSLVAERLTRLLTGPAVSSREASRKRRSVA